MKLEITRFEIWGLFDQFHHILPFSERVSQVGEARVVIVVGINGVGKTTMLDMINGMLQLDFSIFREIPFDNCILSLSTGDKLSIKPNIENTSLTVGFNEVSANLNIKKGGAATEEDNDAVEAFRKIAGPVLKQVSFEKLDIHRSIALRDRDQERSDYEEYVDDDGQRLVIKKNTVGKLRRARLDKSTLSIKVKNFVREAQVDYKKYFSSEVPELFPRIFSKLQKISDSTVTPHDLIIRLNNIKDSEKDMVRFGLAMNIADIDKLLNLLRTEDVTSQSDAAIAALDAYVETLESKHEERQLIASRLKNFEKLIDEFFEGKTVLIDYDKGLSILTASGKEISEIQLSSGEYHLLYMMVTALVSTRTGTAIAIDEPELSLHVGWQRNLIKSLSECASGASPMFILATHSSAIGAEYQDKWIELK